jgi:hypothetical protein
VVVGVIGESIADLTTWIKGERRRHVVERVSVLLLIAGLTAEILAQVQSNNKNSLIVGVLNERAGKAEKDAAEAKLALAKIHEPRHVAANKAQEITGFLRSQPGHTFWIITEKSAIDVDGEQERFANQLSTLFSISGWVKDSHWSRLDGTKSDPERTDVSNQGCRLDTSDEPAAALVARRLSELLAKADIECQPYQFPEIKGEHMVVEIGLK